ncbi:MAG: signal peptide protein, partial [Terriglobales bacterium]
ASSAPAPARKASTKAAPTGAASDSEAAAAKSGGKVWVNLDSGIYHKGGQFYGKTKNGKFMTESEAQAAGYKESKKD